MVPIDEGGVRVIGLDPSLTSFGVGYLTVFPEPSEFRLWTESSEILKPRVTGAQRLLWFYEKITQVIVHADLVVVEGYAYSQGNAMAKMGELGGVVRMAIYESGVPWGDVAPTTLKKFITGKGNAKKDQIMLEVYKRWGFDKATTDEADALGLAMMGATGVYDLNTGLPKTNLEALKKVEWQRLPE